MIKFKPIYKRALNELGMKGNILNLMRWISPKPIVICHDEMLKSFPVGSKTGKSYTLYSNCATSRRNVYFRAVGHFPFMEDPKING